MSHFLDRLRYFEKNVETFSGGHGVVTREDRSWEDGYRKRWQHDKIVRSPVPGRSTSRAASSPGKPSRRTIRALAPICRITSRAAAAAAPAIAGISTPARG